MRYPLHVGDGNILRRGDELAKVEVDKVEDDPQIGEAVLREWVEHVANTNRIRVRQVAEYPQLAEYPLRLRRLHKCV